MKVCFITTSFPRRSRDGYARFVYEQARSLISANQGYEVVVIAPHSQGLAKYEIIDGIEVHRFQYFLPGSIQCLAYQHEGLFSTLRQRRLAVVQLPFFLLSMFYVLLLNSKGAKIIHAQWLPTLVVAVPVGILRKSRVVVTARGADVNQGGSVKLKLLKLLLRRVDTVFVVSDAFRKVFLAEGLGNKVRTLFNGVDHKHIESKDLTALRQRFAVSETRQIILFVGGLIRRKRIDTLLEAVFSLLNREVPLELVIVGEGPSEKELKGMVTLQGRSDSIHFTGRADHDEVLEWMALADIVVLPSESEGRPNVVLEAFAMQTAVIASRIDGTNELIQSGENGLLFSVGDEKELSECISKLVDDRELRAELALAGHRSLVERKLTWRAHGELLHEYYQAGLSK